MPSISKKSLRDRKPKSYWPQLPFQLAAQCGLMVSIPWAPAFSELLCESPTFTGALYGAIQGRWELGQGPGLGTSCILVSPFWCSSQSTASPPQEIPEVMWARALLQLRGHEWPLPKVPRQAAL